MAVTLGNGSGRSNSRYRPMADINVTPLVDVMLVLLIIFMVTAPLLTAGVPVNLPDSRPLKQRPDGSPYGRAAVLAVGTIQVIANAP